MDMIACFSREASDNEFGSLNPFLDQARLRYYLFGRRNWPTSTSLDPAEHGLSGGEFDVYDQRSLFDIQDQQLNNRNASNAFYYVYYSYGRCLGVLRETPTNNKFIAREPGHPILTYMIKDMVRNAREHPSRKRLVDHFDAKDDPAILKMIYNRVSLPKTSDVVELSRGGVAPDLTTSQRRRVMGHLIAAAHKRGMMLGHTKMIALTYPGVWKSQWGWQNEDKDKQCKIGWLGPTVILDEEKVRVGGVRMTEENLARFERNNLGSDPSPILCQACFPERNEILVIDKQNGQWSQKTQKMESVWFKQMHILPHKNSAVESIERLTTDVSNYSQIFHREMLNPHARLIQTPYEMDARPDYAFIP